MLDRTTDNRHGMVYSMTWRAETWYTVWPTGHGMVYIWPGGPGRIYGMAWLFLHVFCAKCSNTSNLTKHLANSNILFELQHGFMEKRACET